MPAAISPRLEAGDLNRRVLIQKPSSTTDADLGLDTDAGITWTTFATVSAAIEPLSGTAVGAPNQNLEGVVTYLVRIRYFPGVVDGMQVYDTSSGLTLDVLAVINIQQAQRQMHLQCASRRYPPV